MVDRWIHGHLAPSQDGCQKFVQESVVETPGGAANAERSLAHWKVRTCLFGYAINDCPVKTRYVEDDRIVFRADNDYKPAGYDWARSSALEMVQHAAAVLLSDYDKRFLTPEFIQQVSEMCRERRVPCVADCKREPEVYTGCLVKCNELYYRNNFEKIRDTHRSWVVTDGCRSPYVQHIKGETFPDLPPVKCVNHVGAGDCFAAHLALALAYGYSIKEAAGIAHSAGRVYVQKPHNEPPRVEEIVADMEGAVTSQ